MLDWPPSPSPAVKPAVADKRLGLSDDETFGPSTTAAKVGNFADSDDETFGPATVGVPLDPNAPQGSYLNDGRVWRITCVISDYVLFL